jgi:hypothetical protein
MPTMEVLADLDRGYVKANKDGRQAKEFPDAAWERWYPYVRALLQDWVDVDILNALAEYIAKNYNKLQTKSCRIHQNYMGECLRIEQYRVSRVLRRLIRDGILIETQSYIVGVRAKSYGCGLRLMQCFKDAKHDLKYRDVHKPYTPGQANSEFLADIRYFVATETPLVDATQIILDKQRDRPKDKVRGVKDIERAFYLWQYRSEGESSRTA